MYSIMVFPITCHLLMHLLHIPLSHILKRSAVCKKSIEVSTIDIACILVLTLTMSSDSFFLTLYIYICIKFFLKKKSENRILFLNIPIRLIMLNN